MDPDFAHLFQRLGEMPKNDGWLDGEGVATTPRAILTLRLAAERLIGSGLMADTYIYPRPCGGCQAEWDLGGVGFELRVLNAGDVCELDVYDRRGTRQGNARFEDECLAFDPRNVTALDEAIGKAAGLIRVYR